MGVGTVTISLPKLPAPTVPDGWTLLGYQVQYDGFSEHSANGKTLREAANALADDFSGDFRVYADCSEDGGSGEQTCEWDSRKNAWGAWEWK